jgi:hypothetical protein
MNYQHRGSSNGSRSPSHYNDAMPPSANGPNGDATVTTNSARCT